MIVPALAQVHIHAFGYSPSHRCDLVNLPPGTTITSNLTHHGTMVFEAYPEEQRDMRWITVTLTSVATLLLICRLTATVRNRGFLGLEDAFVIAANVGVSRDFGTTSLIHHRFA